MRKSFLFGIMLTLILGILNTSAVELNRKDSAQEMGEFALIKGFKESDFQFMEANINTFLYLEDTFLEMKEMEEIQREILNSLDIRGKEIVVENQEYYEPYDGIEEFVEGNIYIHKASDIGYNQIIARAMGNEDGVIVVKVYSIIMDGEKESHIIVDMVKNKGYKDIVELNYQNKTILSKYGSKIESTIGLVGYKAGRLSKADTQKAIKSVASTLRAKKVEEILEETYYSTTMYSPLIPEKINYSDKAVNLQIASRYSEYDDKTYLWIATPLITYTY